MLQMNSIRKLKKILRIGSKLIRKNKIEDTGKERGEGRRRRRRMEIIKRIIFYVIISILNTKQLCNLCIILLMLLLIFSY